ncbi:MAG: hypothetical protein JSW47_15545 [Phycisphaerales bacterium]|nr:MAG: hypothetical protein JSW47_15545 [Phycisphaerales bacterium]
MTKSGLQKRRNLVIVFIYFLATLSAVRRALFVDLRPPDIAVGVAFQVMMTTFCIVDSKCRGRPLLHSFYWIIFFSWPVSVPIYWIWTRGYKGIFTGVLFVISLVVVFAAAYFVTWYLAGDQTWPQ